MASMATFLAREVPYIMGSYSSWLEKQNVEGNKQLAKSEMLRWLREKGYGQQLCSHTPSAQGVGGYGGPGKRM